MPKPIDINAPRAVKNPKAKAAPPPTDPSKLVICNDPLPGKRAFNEEYKYDAKFEELQVGQGLVTQPAETQRIANAMRSWIKRDARSGVKVVSCSNYLDPNTGVPTGTGRVWLIATEGAKK